MYQDLAALDIIVLLGRSNLHTVLLRILLEENVLSVIIVLQAQRTRLDVRWARTWQVLVQQETCYIMELNIFVNLAVQVSPAPSKE
jgi:hypothetical protein